jgi:hypothetical protein
MNRTVLVHRTTEEALSHTFNGGVFIDGSLLKSQDRKVYGGNCVYVILTVRFASKITERISMKSSTRSLQYQLCGEFDSVSQSSVAVTSTLHEVLRQRKHHAMKMHGRVKCKCTYS